MTHYHPVPLEEIDPVLAAAFQQRREEVARWDLDADDDLGRSIDSAIFPATKETDR